jgi:hypothetical protein
VGINGLSCKLSPNERSRGVEKAEVESLLAASMGPDIAENCWRTPMPIMKRRTKERARHDGSGRGDERLKQGYLADSTCC